MLKRFICTAAVLIVGAASLFAQEATFKVKTTLSENDQKKVVEFLKNKTSKDAFSYASPLIDNDAILGSVIAFRALTLGGLSPEYVFVSVPNSAREREIVKSGEAVLASAFQWDYWKEQFAEDVYWTEPVIKDGQTEKGLYALPDKAASFKVANTTGLGQLSVVSTKNWVIDWGTLQKLPFKAVLDSQTRTAMFKMVEGGRADVTLQGFVNTPDMTIEDSGIKLVPVKGVKVALNGNRRFMVSKVNPDGKKVYDALEKGLAVMRASKEIDRALQESGFLNPNVKNWLLIKG